MEKQQVDVMFGTMERKNEALVDTILTDPACRKYGSKESCGVWKTICIFR